MLQKSVEVFIFGFVVVKRVLRRSSYLVGETRRVHLTLSAGLKFWITPSVDYYCQV